MRRIVVHVPPHWLRQALPVAVLLLALGGTTAQAQDSTGQPKVRNVTPDNIPVIILPRRDDAKTRADPGNSDHPVPGDAATATMLEDGTVLADGKALRFFGVSTIPAGLLCEHAGGGRWACGLRAYVALRNFIHGKEIRCETLQPPAGASSRCYRERVNLSEWLLAEGWALYDQKARDEALFRIAEDARKQERGLWANGSRPVTEAQPMPR